jgi:hypothetical protein
MSYDEDNIPGVSLLVAFAIATLAAQEATSSVIGIVVDPAGARIPAARVELTSQDSGLRTEYSHGQGRFVPLYQRHARSVYLGF